MNNLGDPVSSRLDTCIKDRIWSLLLDDLKGKLVSDLHTHILLQTDQALLQSLEVSLHREIRDALDFTIEA